MSSVGHRTTQISRLAAMACVVSAGIVWHPHGVSGEGLGETPQRFELRIENGRLAVGRKTIRVKRDDAVELNWFADRPTVLHLHGYDIEVTVDAGKPQTMSFKARATGRFPVETHDRRHTVLLYLEVHPR